MFEQHSKDVIEGKKEIDVDPQYLQELDDLPPEYDVDEEVDYAINDDDLKRETLNNFGLENYETVDMVINQPEMTPTKTKNYLGYNRAS